MGNAPAQSRSALTRHNPITNATSDAGVNKATRILGNWRPNVNNVAASSAGKRTFSFAAPPEMLLTAALSMAAAGRSVIPTLKAPMSRQPLLGLMHEVGQSCAIRSDGVLLHCHARTALGGCRGCGVLPQILGTRTFYEVLNQDRELASLRSTVSTVSGITGSVAP